MLGDLIYRFGYALGGLGSQFRGKAGAAAGYAPDRAVVQGRAHPPGDGGPLDPDPADGDGGARVIETALVGSALAWVAGRVLRPRPVSWPRVVLAGVAATALGEMARRLEDGLTRRPAPLGEEPAELAARFGAGIAIAAGYASIVYPRIPGPPLFRGLTFAALEIAAAPRGGLIRLAAEEAPALRFPLQSLALGLDEDVGPLTHVAYGLGLGLFYRDGGR